MRRLVCILCSVVVVLAGVCCSNRSSIKESEQAQANLKESRQTQSNLQTIQGNAQVSVDWGGENGDGMANLAGPSVHIWAPPCRYRLYFRMPVDVVPDAEYAVEGVYAQKFIDDIGDPDQGRNGYPLKSSCDRAVKMAWEDISPQELDSNAASLQATLKRYPTQSIFLVTRMRLMKPPSNTASSRPLSKAEVAQAINTPTTYMEKEKARALLIAAPPPQIAPLWRPKGGTATCRVFINANGEIHELVGGGNQLCDIVPWSQFRYKPLVPVGKTAKIETDVEVQFKPRE